MAFRRIEINVYQSIYGNGNDREKHIFKNAEYKDFLFRICSPMFCSIALVNFRVMALQDLLLIKDKS